MRFALSVLRRPNTGTICNPGVIWWAASHPRRSQQAFPLHSVSESLTTTWPVFRLNWCPSRLKGIVHPNLKCHPFTAHHYWMSKEVVETFWVFCREKKFKLMTIQWKPMLVMDKNITCLHTTCVLSSKFLEDEPVQFEFCPTRKS